MLKVISTFFGDRVRENMNWKGFMLRELQNHYCKIKKEQLHSYATCFTCLDEALYLTENKGYI